MPITATHELAREFDIDRTGERVAKRTWACVLTDSTLQNNPPTANEVLTAVGATTWGQSHPEFTQLGLRKYQIVERFGDSPYHVQIVAEYGLLTANDLLSPVDRAAEWTFEAKPGQVPAFYYYADGSNSTKYPLTNSSYDYFEGLLTEESIVAATIKQNFSTFPTTQMLALNCINQGSYFGGDEYTWKCNGVSSKYTTAFHNWNVVQYWETTIDLAYRQSGWLLQLPDVGWNFLSGSEKRRAMVFDFRNGEWVASPNPVALDGNGNQTSGRPEILYRRVNPFIDFAQVFGTPPS